tara:strand:+ start:213 stop:503 length:291 start_codon:yes stop_codon:yes gene_type:complete
MKLEEKILAAVYKTIDNMNDQLDLKIEKSYETVIIGQGSKLDSLGVFTFVTDLEDQIENDFNQSISLINDDFLNGNTEHLENVNQLQKYLLPILEK